MRHICATRAFVMLIQVFENTGARAELLGMSAILVVIGVPLIALLPAKSGVAIADMASPIQG